MEHTKRLLLHYDDDEIRTEIELAIQANAQIRGTADFREGLAAFLEKRVPNWTGR
jgi:methylglutaconyl-CoA hydratase